LLQAAPVAKQRELRAAIESSIAGLAAPAKERVQQLLDAQRAALEGFR
jgi:hypothetical protein